MDDDSLSECEKAQKVGEKCIESHPRTICCESGRDHCENAPPFDLLRVKGLHLLYTFLFTPYCVFFSFKQEKDTQKSKVSGQ